MSFRNDEITVLALVETFLAVSFVLAFSAWMGNLWYLAVWSVLGLTLLLRTSLSTERGISLFAPICEFCAAKLEKISGEGDFDFLFGFNAKPDNIFSIYLYWASKALMLLTLLLALLFGSLYAKTVATLWTAFKSPWSCLKAIPGNWKKAVFCLDLSRPLEFVPGYSAPEWTDSGSELLTDSRQIQSGRPYPRVADVDFRRLWREMKVPAHRIHMSLFVLMVLFLFGCFYVGRMFSDELTSFMYLARDDISSLFTLSTMILGLKAFWNLLLGMMAVILFIAVIAGIYGLLKRLGLHRSSVSWTAIVIVAAALVYLSWDLLTSLFSTYVDSFFEIPDSRLGDKWALVFVATGVGFWSSCFLINRIVQSPVRLLLYVPAFMYRVALKASAVTYLPLIWIFYRTSRSRDVCDEIEDIQTDKFLRTIRAISVVTITIIATKVFLYSLFIEVQIVYDKFPKVVNVFLIPGELPLWHVTALVNAVLALVVYFVSDRWYRQIRRGKFTIHKTADVLLRSHIFLAGILSLYTVGCNVWIAILNFDRIHFPGVGNVFPT